MSETWKSIISFRGLKGVGMRLEIWLFCVKAVMMLIMRENWISALFK